MILRFFGRAFAVVSLVAIGIPVFVIAACTPSEVASFDRVLVNVESIISTASTDAQAACNAAPVVIAAVNTTVNQPTSGTLTSGQQKLASAEAAVSTVCAQAAPATAAIIAALNQVQTYAQSLVTSQEQEFKLRRLFGAVGRSMASRAKLPARG